jgi:hypothetical protein
MRAKYALSLVAAALALFVSWYLWGWSRSPKGQPPLTLLTSTNLDEFKREFNTAADRSRLVLLLSPT